jgi:hypothetical protein
MGYFYLGLAFVGAVVPSSFMGQFLLSHGLDLPELKAQMWAAPISSFTGAAFVIASLVNLFFVWGEGRKLKMKGLWLPLLATLLVGASCGLPLFLYLRGQAAEQHPAPAAEEAAKR